MQDIIRINTMATERTGALPTSTSITRITHTIEALQINECSLSEKINRNHKEPDFSLLNESHQHALEITWGWQQLQQMVEELPDSFLDKNVFLKSVQEGLERGISLLEMTRTYTAPD